MPHVHNGLHHYTRLLDAAGRIVGEKAGAQDFSGIERFGETLTPIVNLWELPEWALWRGEVLFSRVVVAAAAAGRFSSVELVNPVGSGILAVVLEQGLTGATDAQLSVDSGVAIGANPVVDQGVANDTRFPQLGEMSACSITAGDVAAGVALPQDHITTTLRSNRPYILRPGAKLFLIGLTANVAVRLSLLWTERPLLPTEERA